jgi:ligand-binding sensor domain-containing protein
LNPKEIIFPIKPYTYSPNCIFTDSKKNTWVGCSTGLYKIDSMLKLTFINHSDSFSFHCVFEDSKHQLWFSTSEDVMQLNTDQSELFKVKQLEKTNIRNITETDNKLWFSGNKGLFSYSLLNNGKVKYGISEGLPDLMIYGVIPVNNCLWISSNNGLSKFDIKNKTFRNFHLSDGLQSNEFNSNAFFKATNGWLYFGGINGFNYFDPNKIIDNPNKPKTVITNIKLFDIDLPINKEISLLNKITMKHDQNILSFDFSSLEFTDVSKNKFAYKMEGIDTGWVNSDSRNFVRYANIEPGNYVFKVKSYNNV